MAGILKFSLLLVVVAVVDTDMAVIAATRFTMPTKVAASADADFVCTGLLIRMRRGVRKLPPKRTNEQDSRNNGNDDGDFIPFFVSHSATDELIAVLTG